MTSLCEPIHAWMRRVRKHRSSGLGRSLTLLRAFLLASALILALGAVALSSTLSRDLRDAALDDTALDVGGYADACSLPRFVPRRRRRAGARRRVGGSPARCGCRATFAV